MRHQDTEAAINIQQGLGCLCEEKTKKVQSINLQNQVVEILPSNDDEASLAAEGQKPANSRSYVRGPRSKSIEPESEGKEVTEMLHRIELDNTAIATKTTFPHKVNKAKTIFHDKEGSRHLMEKQHLANYENEDMEGYNDVENKVYSAHEKRLKDNK